jgi:hypothetical protein
MGKFFDKVMKWRGKYLELDQPGCEIYTEVYYEKKRIEMARKKKKKFNVLWWNTIQLGSNYKGRMLIYKKLVFWL